MSSKHFFLLILAIEKIKEAKKGGGAEYIIDCFVLDDYQQHHFFQSGLIICISKLLLLLAIENCILVLQFPCLSFGSSNLKMCLLVGISNQFFSNQ